MRHLCILILIASFYSPLQGQEFAATGTFWEHCFLEEPFGGPLECCRTVEYHSVDAFEFNGMTCHTITYTSPNKRTFLFVDSFQLCNLGEQVYYKVGDSTFLLYDFGLEAGESYDLRYPMELMMYRWDDNWPIDTVSTIYIDAVAEIELNGRMLKRQFISTSATHCLYPGGYITESIGFDEWILPPCEAGNQDCCHFYGLMEVGDSQWSYNPQSQCPGGYSPPDKSLVSHRYRWNVKTSSLVSPDLGTIRYTFSEDSIEINSHFYKRLLFEVVNVDNGYREGGLYREQNEKVWESTPQGDRLIYDFSLEVGDTFFISDENPEGRFLIVTSIDSVALNAGITRKRLTLECGMNPDLYPQHIWIEGAGDLYGLLSVDKSCMTDIGTKLLCYFVDNSLVYMAPDEEGCLVLPNSNVLPDFLQIYPNPASDYIFIDSDHSLDEMVLYDIYGRVVLHSEATSRLDVTQVAAGTYFLYLKVKGDEEYVKRVIVE